MDAVADLRFMGLAIALARGQLGRTAPNPAVGCVLVRDGAVVATGATADGGRPHAERVALDKAGGEALGCTAYVTLEPCSHHGQTPPCAGALIDAGVARVVVACADRDARVSGRGIAMLRAAGLAVAEGVAAEDAIALYKGFFHRLETGRPLVLADRRRATYEATIDPVPPTEIAATLDRLGERGLSRVRVEPGTGFADALVAQGLAWPVGPAGVDGRNGDTVY